MSCVFVDIVGDVLFHYVVDVILGIIGILNIVHIFLVTSRIIGRLVLKVFCKSFI